MKKWILLCLAIAVVFANEGIYDYYDKNKDIPSADGTTFRERLRPNFDSDMYNNSDSEANFIIHCAVLCGRSNSPTIIFLNNFFTSYYEIVMQHTPKDKKQEIKKIVKETMELREELDGCNRKDMSSSLSQMCSQEHIGDAYVYGIQELSKYVSLNNPNFLDSIFLQYAKEIEKIEREGDKVKLLDKLYIDNLIDETGKLIIEVD